MEQKLVEEAAQTLRDEIDWQVMMNILLEVGYIHISMSWSERMNESLAHKIKEWCRDNLKEDYHGRGKDWYFKSEKDATVFVLRWS